jgi:hypothetical protein
MLGTVSPAVPISSLTISALPVTVATARTAVALAVTTLLVCR